MTLTVLAWIINIWNIFYLGLYPLYKRIWVIHLLHTRADEIKFLYSEYDKYGWTPKNKIYEQPAAGQINYIICELWIDDAHFLKWKMTEQGEILIYEPGSKRRWWLDRESMIYFGPKQNKSKKFTFLKHRIIRTHSTRGIVGWAIRRYTAEPFIMAKLAGFEKHNITDYID